MALREGTYGLLAEFDTPSQLVHAAQSAYDSGYRRMDCYTPYAVHGAAEAIGFHKNTVPLVTLIGGLLGAAAMFGMETWISVWAFRSIRGPSLLLLAGFCGARPMSGPFFTRVFPRPSECSPCAGFRSCTIRCSMRQTSATARPRTSSSFVLSPPIPSLI